MPGHAGKPWHPQKNKVDFTPETEPPVRTHRTYDETLGYLKKLKQAGVENVALCVAGWQTLGLMPATLLLIWFTTWYMSLQHELIHGHPTRLAWFNQLLGTLPLAVWYPYGVYRDSHLAHHRNHLLTHPEDDPESYYVTAESWQRFSAWQRRLIHLRNTFWGRLLLAPMMDIIHTLNSAL